MDEADPGRLRKVDPSVVDDDPFWSVVRRRHPDVEIVLLPPDDDATDGAADRPTVATDVVRTVADDAVEEWAALAPLIAARGVEDAPSVRWADAPGGHALLVKKGIRGLGADGGTDLLRDIAFRLGERGWRLSATSRADRPLLRATNGLLDLEGEAGPGATVLTLATKVLPVAAPDRDAVRAEVVEAVAAWA